MKSHLERNKDINSISAILELSYHNLPPEWKACFLCLGFFKEDAIIKVKYLVHIWVAQGLVAQEVVGEEETMEDVATNYLNQLISRNMVQVKRSKYDVVKACSMHDLLRDLSQRKAVEEINLEILMREEGDSHHSLHKPRHRAIYCSGIRFASSSNRDRYLRSLLIHARNVVVRSSYLKSLELLRVLDLGSAELEVLPKAVGELTGLRYIKIRVWIGGHIKLPRSWDKLTNLQVLDLRRGAWYAWFLILDEVILKMDCLRHLYALISPRSKVPLANMRSLRTVKRFHLNESRAWLIQGMAGVNNLEFDMTQVSDATQLFTHLASLGNLISLTLKHPREPLNMDGLAALHHITQLKLKYFDGMTRLPTNFPPKLCYLTLSRMQLTQDSMPVLERLPELLHLKLQDIAYRGEEMVISHHGFPRLEVLRLIHMWGVRNIQVEKGGMPELKHLFINHCSDLNIESLPEHLKSAI